jgi:hypothetical protein
VPRHDLDPIALVFGAVFIVFAVVAEATHWSWIGGDRSWLLGAFLIALGLAGVVTATIRRRNDDQADRAAR